MFRPKIINSLKGYSFATFQSDLFAGVTVGFVAFPLAMAFAIASGVPPERGLFTAFIAGFIISALGGSRVQIGGPTGAFVVIISGIIASYGYEGLVYCTIMAGLLLIVLGFTKMGGLIRFIPFPVTTGFTAGIAVIIFSTQIKDLLGLQIEELPAEMIEQWVVYGQHVSNFDMISTSVGVVTILLIIFLHRYLPKLPSMLFAMVCMTAITVLFQFDIPTIGSRFGELPRMLPSPSLPAFDWEKIRLLVSPAFTVAMLAAIESLLSATVADGMTGDRHNPNVELIAQGVANIGSVFWGGIPATGAIARTATNIKSGALTPISGIIHAIVLLLMLLLLAPLAKLIPMTVLAAILMVVAFNMSEFKNFKSFLRLPKSDAMVLISTFSITILIDLVVAVEIGIVLAAFLFIKRMSEVTNVGMITRDIKNGDSEKPDENSITTRVVPDYVEVFEIQGPFFFGAADKFRDVIQYLESDLQVIILRMRNVPAIDATGLHVLTEFIHRCRKHGMHVVLSGIMTQPLDAIIKSGLYNEIGEDNILSNIDDALLRAEDIISEKSNLN